MKKIISYLLLFIVSFLLPISIYAKEDDHLKLYFFHGEECSHCAEERVYLEELKEKYPDLEIVQYEVWHNYDNSELLNKVHNAFEVQTRGVPTNVIGETMIMGFSESKASQIERAIDYYKENEYIDAVEQIKNGTYKKNEKDDSFEKEEQQLDESLTIDVPLFGKVNVKNFSLSIAAALIGLVDGFNPCAMWVLLFLISVLIGMKDRKRMWILGSVFLLTSGLFYLLIMLSWIHVVVKMTTMVWIRNIIAIIAIIGALINLTRFFDSNDSGCDVVDESKRKKIFKRIRKFTSEKSLILAIIGIMGLAISVNIVELACSAGLPIVFSELLALNNVNWSMKFLYTLVYILFFMLDDFIVFIIAMLSMKVTGISTKYNKYSHLIGGIIMLLVGVLLLWKPGWLMFQFK